MLIIIKRTLCFLLGGLLCADSLYLFFHNKFDFWTILPSVLGGFLLVYSLAYHPIHRVLNEHAALYRLWRWGWFLLLLWSVTLLLFFIHLQQKTQQYPQMPLPQVQAILVLGSGIENGQPSAILAKRLDTAATLAQQQPQAIMIVSGGLDVREQHTEAEIMANYLYQHYHLEPQRIHLENQSTSTELNLANSKAILQQQSIPLHASIAIVTSDFHTPRAAAIARKQGYQHAVMVSAPTPLQTRYHVWLREYFALISGWLLNEY